MNACDALDGVKDGVITDPTKCQFDPASLQCKGSRPGELSDRSPGGDCERNLCRAQSIREPAQSLYPGLPRGSEFGWDGLDRIPGPAAIPPYAAIFQWVFGTDWDWRQFDFDHEDAVFTQKLAAMVNATSPDIDAFRAHGHKLLMYHGWSRLARGARGIDQLLERRGRAGKRLPRPASRLINRSGSSWFLAWRIAAAVPGQRISMPWAPWSIG